MGHLHVALRAIQKREKLMVYGRGWNVIAARFSKTRRDAARFDPEALSDISDILDPMGGLQVPSKLGHRRILDPVTRSLDERGIRSDRAMFAIAMQQRAVIHGSPDSAAHLFNAMLARGIHPTAHHYAALMEGYSRKGDMAAAVATLDAARAAGIKPNVVLYTILIAGYARQGKPESAMRVFHDMVASGVKPDVGAIDAVSSAYFAVGLYAMARSTLIELWPEIMPFPSELRTANLKTLSRTFRAMAKQTMQSKTRPDLDAEEMTGRERRVLKWHLARLLTLWKRVVHPDVTRKRLLTVKTTGKWPQSR
jgi:pentatricopeptide repeat protein